MNFAQQVSCYATEYYCAYFIWLLSQENLLVMLMY